MCPPGQDAEKRAGGDAAVRLQALLGQPHVADAFVRFRLDLLAAQQDARRAWVEAAAVPGTSAQSTAAAFPLCPGDVPFPNQVLSTLFEAIRTASATHGHETEEVSRLSAAVAADPSLLRSLAAAAAFGPDLMAIESLARRIDVYAEVLMFVGRALAAPCVAEAVRARATEAAPPTEQEEPHRCPACGSVPSVARLRRADGRRVLICGLCGSEWIAIRLACACCGTRDRTALSLLRLHDSDARWVETCDQCKGYIKTVDERKLPEGEAIVPVVEEAATLHLDLLAEREGYIRRVPYALSG